jgi:streptogramin lyase
MHSLRFFLSSLVVISACSLSVRAATVEGTVKGPGGAPFMGAFVQAKNQQNNMLYSVLSDKQGHYRIEKLSAGSYQIQIRAIGYKAEPQSGVKVSGDQNVSFDFALQPGTVRWGDLSLYQGHRLLPEGKGKDALMSNCMVCHGFQNVMASTPRTEAGWRDRINYMRKAMWWQLPRFDDDKADAVVSYLSNLFGNNPAAPRYPTDVPEYKDTLRTFGEDATNIVYVECDVSGSKGLPWSATPDKDGNLWMPYYGRGNEVARLNPNTGEVRRFLLPFEESAGVHSSVPAPDGTVWFTEYALNKIAKLDPQTGKITEFQDSGDVPGERPSKHTARVDALGNVWTSGSPVTKFDPTTGKFTHFMDAPSSYGITFDKDGNTWFVVLKTDGTVGRIDAKSGKVTHWSPPTKGMPQRLDIDSKGIVYFSERQGSKIGRFDPKTETFKEYPLPGPAGTPYAILVERDDTVWYNSNDQDTIGHLYPDTPRWSLQNRPCVVTSKPAT